MIFFRDHADAMRVIGHTFTAHEAADFPCQSWMVRRAATDDHVSSSAYHFVVTWLPGRALIITGDIGETVYTGISYFHSLDETLRLVRESSFDYLSGKSTHQKQFDRKRTAELIVELAYAEMRPFDPNADDGRRTTLMARIVDWHDGNLHGTMEHPSAADRKAACRALIDDDTVSAEDLVDIGNDWEICRNSYPPAAHWHYEALRTWAKLLTIERTKQKLAQARAAQAAQQPEPQP